jgi:hypothetical protein
MAAGGAPTISVHLRKELAKTPFHGHDGAVLSIVAFGREGARAYGYLKDVLAPAVRPLFANRTEILVNEDVVRNLIFAGYSKRKAGDGLADQKIFDKSKKKAKGEAAGAGAGAGASKDEEEEDEEETLESFLASHKAHFTFFRSKKAINLEGAVIKPIVLTATEEDSFEPADLMKLAKWGLVKEEEAGAGSK